MQAGVRGHRIKFELPANEHHARVEVRSDIVMLVVNGFLRGADIDVVEVRFAGAFVEPAGLVGRDPHPGGMGIASDGLKMLSIGEVGGNAGRVEHAGALGPVRALRAAKRNEGHHISSLRSSRQIGPAKSQSQVHRQCPVSNTKHALEQRDQARIICSWLPRDRKFASELSTR